MPRLARLFFLFLLIAKLTLPLSASLPELSSIEPLEFDEAAQRLVARGDARLDFQDTRLIADRITYYQEYSLADALGNLVGRIEEELGAPLQDLDRSGKQSAIRLLDDRGAFQLRKSIEDVADLMGVSRITIYNYLNAIRA